MTGDFFDSPEAAALAGWSQTPEGAPRIGQVRVRGRRAEVVLDLEPDYRTWVYCVHGAPELAVPVSGNGPTLNGDDPDAYGWQP